MVNAHPQYEEDFELYGLGVLDGGDKAEFETHLAGCPDCRPKLAKARTWLVRLALAAPPIDPPPAVRDRVLESFRARGRTRFEVAPPVTARRGLWTPFGAQAWAGVCLILLMAAAWLAIDHLRLTRRLAELETIRIQLNASNLDLKTATARAQAVLDVLTSPRTVQVDLSPASAHPVPNGKAFYNRAQGLLFYTTNLRSLPSGRTYELWLIPTEGKPVNIGLFNTDTQGNGQVVLPSLPRGPTAKAFAVTVEPAGGVPAPTGPIVLVGPVA
jgi:anti-sigma-K factor RskA